MTVGAYFGKALFGAALVAAPVFSAAASWFLDLPYPRAVSLAAFVTLLPAGCWFWALRNVQQLQINAEAATADRSRLLRALDELPDGLVVLGADRTVKAFNAQYLNFYRIGADELKVGTSLEELRELRNRRGLPVLNQRGGPAADLTGQSPVSAIWELPDGRLINVRLHGLAGGGWIAQHCDVTEATEKSQHLDEARQFLNTIIKNIPEAISVKDATTLKYRLANTAFETLSGQPIGKIIGNKSKDIFDAAEADAILSIDTKSLVQAAKGSMTRERPYRVNGKTYALRTKNIVLKDPTGRPSCILTIDQDVTDQRRMEQDLREKAMHDELTGLQNRFAFNESIASRAQSESESWVLVLADVDGFKEINDTLGHTCGDTVLRDIGEKFRTLLAPGECAFRLGGDEFALLLQGKSDDRETLLSIEALKAAAESNVYFDDKRVAVKMSAGLAHLLPGDSADSASQRADIALYESKSSDRGRVSVFVPEMLERRQARKILERDLALAVQNDEFEPYFQPIVDAKSGRIVSMEALVRWRHPERGLIAPDNFIPVAEECGLIIPIGELMLRKSCHLAAQWTNPVRVSVNLSPVQFGMDQLGEVVTNILKETGLAPSRLELEITEASLLSDDPAILETLTGLRARGVRVAMDDFGTGYSSLNYLRMFPFDKIKIDKSYVRDLESGNSSARRLIRSIISLATNLEIPTTAEGVEDESQRDFLAAAGCKELQGYYFSRPVPQSELAKFTDLWTSNDDYELSRAEVA